MGEEGCWVGFFLSSTSFSSSFSSSLSSLRFSVSFFGFLSPLFYLFPFSFPFVLCLFLFFCLLFSPLYVFPLPSVLVWFKPSQLLMTRGFADCSKLG